MKTISNTVLYLQMTALLVATALAGPSAAENSVPFRGSIHAIEASVVHPPTLGVDGSGSGNASHIGRFTVTYEVEVNLVTRASTGTAHFTAANGDTIDTDISGQGNPIPGSDYSYIVETNTISGGTGRFADATGTFVVERLLNRVTGITTGSFSGSVSY